MWSQTWLRENRALPPDAVVIAFDWPSQRIYQNDVRDINEKGRRAYIAGYHLARFVLEFPPSSRICFLGQSYGGRVVTNPSGGLLSKGHPLGATGLAQCYELTHQLRGSAEQRQVEGARLALQHNLGLGGACVVTLYERA